MPTYIYQVICQDGSDGPRFEITQSMKDPPLTHHPETGEPVRQVFSPPQLVSRYSEGRTRRLLDNKNVERAGFTKYERDAASGSYHRVAGAQGPDALRP